MANKKLTPKQKAWKVFLDSYNDPEIGKRYEGFLSNHKSMIERYNPQVEAFNEKTEKKKSLEELLLNVVKSGFHQQVSPILEEIKAIDGELQELVQELSSLKSSIEYHQDLITKYKDWSERKLFIHWEHLKALDEGVPIWTSFKAKYNKIF